MKAVTHILTVAAAISLSLGVQVATVYTYYHVNGKSTRQTMQDDGLSHLRAMCCDTGTCDLSDVLDKFCHDKNESCPLFPLKGPEPCRMRKTCFVRLKKLPRYPNAPSDVVMACLDAALQIANFTTALKTHPPPVLSTPWIFTPQDLPFVIARTNHFCWRPCTKDWPCQGKNGHGKFARDPCWKNFYRPGKHHKIRKHKSLMAVWGPPVQDQISALVSKKNGYDPKLQACVRRFLDHPPGMVYDVGSNLGVVSLLSVNLGHRVVAFDPTPWTRNKLQLSIWLNNMSHAISVVPAAAGNHTGTARLVNVPGNLGGNQISSTSNTQTSSHTGPSEKGGIITNITTLDEVFFGGVAPREPPFFIKIDVEGHEIQVVQGAKRLLSTHKPGLIIETCEWCSPADLFTLLQSIGYVCGRDTPLIERTASPLPGQWLWDVVPVLYPQKRSQLRPNVACIYDPPAASLPFDTTDPSKLVKKQWKSYSVEEE